MTTYIFRVRTAAGRVSDKPSFLGVSPWFLLIRTDPARIFYRYRSSSRPHLNQNLTFGAHEAPASAGGEGVGVGRDRAILARVWGASGPGEGQRSALGRF